MQKWKKAEKKVVLILVSHVKIYLWYVQSLCGHAHFFATFWRHFVLVENPICVTSVAGSISLCFFCVFMDILHLLKVSWIILMCVGFFLCASFGSHCVRFVLYHGDFALLCLGFFTLALGVLWSLFITLWLLCFSFHSVVILCLLFTFHGFIFYGFMVFFSKIVNILDLFLCLFEKINLFMSQRGHIKSIHFCGHFTSISCLYVDILYPFMTFCGHFGFFFLISFYWYLCLYLFWSLLHLLMLLCRIWSSGLRLF